jgi:hypothetical protein
MPSPFRLTSLALLLAGAAHAASPRDELLRSVPDDHGFCAVFTGLPKVAARLRESPFAAALAKATEKGAPAVKEWEELRKITDDVRKRLAVSWEKLVDVFPGEAFAFVYRPGPPGKPELEEALFLLRSRDGRTLALVVNGLNLLQNVSLEKAEHKGVSYIRRTEPEEEGKGPRGGKRTFYLLKGPVLLFSGQESMLKRAIEQELALAKDATPAVAKRLTALGMSESPAAIVLNPRAFDAHIAAGTGKEAETLAKWWKALDAAGLALDIGRDAALSLAFVGRTKDLPEAARKLFEASAKPSSLWGSFPEKPLLAVAWRIDLRGLYGAVRELMPDASREALEKNLDLMITAIYRKDVIEDLLPVIGPDWGLCLFAPPAGSKETHPRVLAAVKLNGSDETVDTLLEMALNGVRWVVASHNGKHAAGKRTDNKLTFEKIGTGREVIRVIESKKGLAVGMRPAWALRAGHFVAATSPDLIAAFKAAASPPAEGPVPLLRVSFSAWRKFVKDQREALAADLVSKERLKEEEAAARLAALDAGLALLDTLELTRHDGPSRVTFTLRLKTAEPLLK